VHWDLEAVFIIALQDLLQLSKGEIFDNSGDWREARAQIMTQEVGFKVMVSVLSNDKGQRPRQQVGGIIIKEPIQPPSAANTDS
jgi:hypothetical protein